MIHTIESVDLTSTEQNAFNAQFTAYEGSQRGATVRSLIQMVSMNNQSSDKKVSIVFKGTTYSDSNVSSVSSQVFTSNTYNITIKYNSNKYVENILID